MTTIRRSKPGEQVRTFDGVQFPPNRSIALVAENDSEIVGTVFLVEPLHIEGPWVKESERGGILGYRLMQAAENAARGIKVKTLFAYAATDELADYLQRLGYSKMPLTVYAKEL